jgi:hypothetical protein
LTTKGTEGAKDGKGKEMDTNGTEVRDLATKSTEGAKKGREKGLATNRAEED